MLFLVTVSFAQELYALPPAHAHREVEWVDEGTYVLPPPGLSPGDERYDAAGVWWRYEGPNLYTVYPESYPGVIVSRPVPEPESFDAWMATVTKVDGDGQIWRMVDIDPEVFDSQAIAQIEENIANATDEDEVDEWTPFSWTMGTCPGNIPAAIWSGETRSSNTSFSTNRAANAVYTYLPVASVRALSSRGPSPGGATLSPQHIALPHPVDRQRP